MTIAKRFGSPILIPALTIAGLLTAAGINADTRPDTISANDRYTIKPADCIDFINEAPTEVQCGFIELPADHDNTDSSGLVTLPILVARQTSASTASNKAIFIPGGGGPGASMGFGYEYNPGDYLSYYSSLRAAGFDIVIVDQRGAGLSKPLLRCHETTPVFTQSLVREPSLVADLKAYKAALARCRQRLISNGLEPIDFDTYQSARDFMAIMNALPYTQWNTLATSYATVIAQVIEALQPATFERIVLDSPVPLDYQSPYTQEVAEAAVTRVLSLCEITRRCNRRHKNIKEKFTKVLQRAKAEPLRVDVRVTDTDSESANKKLILNDIVLLDILIFSSYNNFYLAELPDLIDKLFKKQHQAIKGFAEDYWNSSIDPDYADALSWTVHCMERQPLEEKFLLKHPQHESTFSEVSRLIMQQEQVICDAWDLGDTPKFNINARFSPRTLIVAGDLDPVISKQDIANTANNFIDQETIIMPGTGHSVWFQSKCTRDSVTAFFTHNEFLPCQDGLTRFR